MHPLLLLPTAWHTRCCPLHGNGAQSNTPAPSQRCPRRQDKMCVSLGDASIQVQQGRPDVEALLRRAAAEEGPGSVVGVYAGGEPGQL